MFGQGKKTYPLYSEKSGTKKANVESITPKTNKNLTCPRARGLIAQKDNEIDELQKSIQEDRGTADEENEDQAIKERARERKIENKERIDDLENERKELEEGT